jgi:phosphoribosyl-AMP cyclohydrolase
MSDPSWLSEVKFSQDGLIPAIAQDATSGRILMVAWMNQTALEQTVLSGEAVYWSRSRAKLWHKGEESGHIQQVSEIRLDCDGDVITLQVKQAGGIACHTGRESCFYRVLKQGEWQEVDPIVKSPEEIYGQ